MRKAEFVIILILAVLLPFTPACRGEEEKEGAHELEEIIVTAPKPEDVPDYVQDVISPEEIRRPVMSGSVLDALGNQAGIQFQRGSLSSSESGKLRLRGFNENRLRILRDGIPVHRDGSFGNGPVDWSTLSGEDVERIEIHRGAGPAKFGNTLGGVVNIVTRKPDEKPETSISTVYGSHDTWDTKASHAWKIGPAAWSLSASHYETDGYLRNNFTERDNFSADLSFDLSGGFEMGAGLTVSDMENGNPVYNRPDSPYYKGGDPDADERELGGPGIGARLLQGAFAWGERSATEDENIAFTAFGLKKFASGHIRTDFRIWNQDRHEVYYDATDSNKKIYERDTKAEDDNWSLQAEAVFQLGAHRLEAGGEVQRHGWGEQTVRFIDESYFNGSINFFKFIREGFKGQPDTLGYYAAYVQDTWEIHPKVTLEAGLRQEWFEADSIDSDAFGFDWPAEVGELDENHADPRVALTVRPWEGGSFTARFGIAHRYPTSPEYFWWYLNNGTGFFNTDFNSEEARQYELSYEQSVSDMFDFFVRGYYYDIRDYIASTFVPGVGSVYYNIGEAEIKGTEIGVSADLPYNLRAWANFTWQEGDKDDDPWDTENQLAGQLADFPEIMFNAGLDYAYGEKFTARLWLNYVDDREHFKGRELTELDAYTLLNASATYRVCETKHGKWDLLLSAANLLDEDYEEEEGYPMAGATVIGGVRVSF
ncbi:TonB-dependent receptor [Desulfonema ishimotonii]|uniref:TonB-dependent receptor n=1 Tax=Desulfonema ishimotonii TaxID=45657 RepID=A0A401G2B1_9BACT|nr:TonB-dependent receptor [Desulfonema ishimotonii]GBC63335.1 TonB-dependent receptor [Desulfonema ishimotonii]